MSVSQRGAVLGNHDVQVQGCGFSCWPARWRDHKAGPHNKQRSIDLHGELPSKIYFVDFSHRLSGVGFLKHVVSEGFE
jgi:hypothetical protein